MDRTRRPHPRTLSAANIVGRAGLAKCLVSRDNLLSRGVGRRYFGANGGPMRIAVGSVIASFALVTACGGSAPVPDAEHTKALADIRAAEEIGGRP